MDQCQFVFDIESYKRQSRMKELIVNPLRECCKKILEKMQDSNGEHTKRKYFHRHHASTNQRLIDDYFSNQPTYDETLFWVNILFESILYGAMEMKPREKWNTLTMGLLQNK
jgi:hypothetical protein